MTQIDGPESLFVTVADGIRIHAALYGPRDPEQPPVVCLPGLARTGSDFSALAATLAARGRRMIVIDSRGRGRSDRDANPGHYNPTVEMLDVLAVLTALAAEPAVIVGTSRGGILAMLMAAARPSAIAGAVLNDIGPVIERDGLLRIKGYVGKLPAPKDHDAGAAILRAAFGAHFPRLSDADWHAWSQRNWVAEDGGRLVAAYDPAITQTLAAVGPDTPLLPLWDQFGALATVPVMIIRGALSDILSAQTVSAMKVAKPDLEILEVADQGHAPLLNDAETMNAIAGFVARCRQGSRRA